MMLRQPLLILLATPFLSAACSAKEPQFSTGRTGGASGEASDAGKFAGDGGQSGASRGVAGLDAGSDVSMACAANTECDDGDACNGIETCSAGQCAAETALADGTACTPALPDGGRVASQPAEGGGASYRCDQGVCRFTCSKDADCDDGDVCTGTESCSPATNTCQRGTPLECRDENACTENRCDPARGCIFPLLDADADGHAPVSLGSCGDDCDDHDETVFTGAGELCDGKNNDCDEQTDETAPVWYVDCDADGFAPQGAASMQQCVKPPATATCGPGGGNWTTLQPRTLATTDCRDDEPNARPRDATENPSAWSASPIAGAPTSRDYDWNCDGVEEPRYAVGNISTTSPCPYCSGPAGWSGAVPPCDVAATGTYSACSSGCLRTVTAGFHQQCR